MTLLDRYLRAVAAQLPKDTRDDIVAELRDVALNKFEAREAELGRPLTEAEQEALIRELGHPLTVAGRYARGPSHLIGPELYPYWLFAVKVGLAAVTAITVLVAFAQVLGGDIAGAQVFSHIINGVIQGGLTLIGCATVAGFVLERQTTRPKFMTQWRVKDLGLFELAALDTESLDRQLNSGEYKGKYRGMYMSWGGRRGSPVGNAVANAVLCTVFLLWWVGALPVTNLRAGFEVGDIVVGATDYGVIANSLLDAAFWPVIVYLIARIALEVFRAWRPAARRPIALGQLVLAGARLAAFWWIWTVSALAPVIHLDSVQALVDTVHRLFSGGIHVQAIIVVSMVFATFEAAASLAINLWRLVAPSPREGLAA